MSLLAVDRQVNGELLDCIEVEAVQLGIGLSRAKSLRAGNLLALEERVGELHPESHVGRAGASWSRAEFDRREGRSIQRGAATAASAAASTASGIGISHRRRGLEIGHSHN